MICVIKRSASSPIHLPENDVERADYGDHVSHKLAAAHYIESLQIHKRRRSHAQAIGLRRPIADNEISQLALRRFDRVINLARRWLHHLRDFGHDVPLGKRVHSLLNDAHRLPHLGHSHQISIVGIAVLSGGNIEIEVLIVGVGLGLAQIHLHPTGAEHRPGDTQSDTIFAGNYADVPGALDPDAIRGKQFLVLVNFRPEEIEEILHFPFKAVISFVLQPANAEGMRSQPRPAIFFVDLQYLFAITERVKQWRDGADIERVRTQPKLMAGDAVQFGKDYAHVLRSRRRFHVEKFFHGLAVYQPG